MQNKRNTAFERLIFAASSNTMRHWDSVYAVHVIIRIKFTLLRLIGLR